MSGTMSRSTNEWLQFYQNNQAAAVQSWSGDAATDATVVTSSNTSVSNQLSRVTRPTNTRRRSRASRKTPTTLVNTDATNFRAMVQRFTGGGSSGGDVAAAPFLSNESSTSATSQFLNTYNSNSSGFNDRVGSSSSVVQALRPDGGYNMQFRQPHSQPYFTMPIDDGGHDQHPGFSQRGSYKAANSSNEYFGEENNYMF